MIEIAIDAIEVTCQALLYLALGLVLRAMGRAVISRQLTFYKVYGANLTGMFMSSFLDFARADQRFSVRLPYALALTLYTTAIVILIGSPHPSMESVHEELMFPALFLTGAAVQLLLRDDETRSLRHFLFAPLIVAMLWLILSGVELHLGLSRFHEVHQITYVGLTSLPAAFALIGSLALAFIFLAATREERSGWQKLLEDVSAITLLSPILVVFLNEGTGATWVSVFLWAIKTGVILVSFDMIRMFFPKFRLRQPEATLVRVALPLSSLLFLFMWVTRSMQ